MVPKNEYANLTPTPGTPQRNTLCYNNPWSLSAAHRPTVRTGGGSDPEPAAGAVGLWSEGGGSDPEPAAGDAGPLF